MNPFVAALPWVLCGTLGATVIVLGWQLRLNRRRRIAAESSLGDIESRLRRISRAVESASDAIGIGDFEGHSLYHNPAHVALFGYTEDELNAVPGSGALFADVTVAKRIHASIRAGQSWTGETEVKTKDGRHIPALVRADIILDEQQKPVGIFGVFTDITERRRAAALLDEERQRLSITLESIADGVITTDSQGRVELMNRVAEELTGWPRSEGERQPLTSVLQLELIHPRRAYDPTSAPIAPDTRSPLASNLCLLRNRGGQEKIVAERTTPVDRGPIEAMGRVIVFRDVTVERQRAQEQERADRLESLGLLAGGVAHDFANLLMGIQGHLGLALGHPISPEAAHSLELASSAAARAATLTRQLLTFARGGVLEKKSVIVGDLIRDSVALVVATAPKLKSRFSTGPDVPPLVGDPVQLGQVFHNLALNASQAMDNTGELLVSVQRVRPGSPEETTTEGVRIRFVDTGKGIAPEHLTRIFEPFFTTRKAGTGLGLATAHSIVRQHGGELTVESTVGQGTTFQIFLPTAPIAGAPVSRGQPTLAAR